MQMEKIPSISSTKTLLSEQLLNILNANNAFDDSLIKFNDISSARHLNLNILIRNHIKDDSNDMLNGNLPQPSNNIF